MNTPAASVDHALLTRFNLPSPGAESLVRAQDGWLRNRVALFESWCLPSVQAQTTTEFSWLVYFDPDSPAWLRERIDRWASTTPLTPSFRVEVPRAQLLADLAAVTGARHDRLLTTNLDNDDAIAADFVARLQSAPPTSGRVAIYCPQGLVATEGRVFRHLDRRNAFCSVREPWVEASTCWSEWHNLLERHMPVRELDGRPAWLQVVHGQNVSNRVRGRLVSPTAFRADFPGLLDDLPAASASVVRRDRFVDGPRRAARDRTRTAFRVAGVRLLGRDQFDHAKNLHARLRGDLAHRTHPTT